MYTHTHTVTFTGGEVCRETEIRANWQEALTAGMAKQGLWSSDPFFYNCVKNWPTTPSFIHCTHGGHLLATVVVAQPNLTSFDRSLLFIPSTKDIWLSNSIYKIIIKNIKKYSEMGLSLIVNYIIDMEDIT